MCEANITVIISQMKQSCYDVMLLHVPARGFISKCLGASPYHAVFRYYFVVGYSRNGYVIKNGNMTAILEMIKVNHAELSSGMDAAS